MKGTIKGEKEEKGKENERGKLRAKRKNPDDQRIDNRCYERRRKKAYSRFALDELGEGGEDPGGEAGRRGAADNVGQGRHELVGATLVLQHLEDELLERGGGQAKKEMLTMIDDDVRMRTRMGRLTHTNNEEESKR